MSRGLVCDQCGDTLVLNARGDDQDGEKGAWLNIQVGDNSDLAADLCSRSCAIAWLEDPAVIQAMTEWQECLVGVALTIKEGQDDAG